VAGAPTVDVEEERRIVRDEQPQAGPSSERHAAKRPPWAGLNAGRRGAFAGGRERDGGDRRGHRRQCQQWFRTHPHSYTPATVIGWRCGPDRSGRLTTQPLQRTRNVPAILKRPHPLAVEAACPSQQAIEAAPADHDRLLAP